ncbi:hypothetical protein HQ563_05430 [bacterium]|nr:hypothetical protein [bacterium]
MLQAKLISSKNCDDLEKDLNAFLQGQEASKIKQVSGVSVVRHPTIGADTYAIVVTYEE